MTEVAHFVRTKKQAHGVAVFFEKKSKGLLLLSVRFYRVQLRDSRHDLKISWPLKVFMEYAVF